MFKKITIYLFWLVLIIHFTIKDYFYITALFFYASPLPILILGSLFLIIIIKKRRKYYTFLALVLAFIWMKNSFATNYVTNEANGLEVVLWNAYRTENFEDAFNTAKSIPDVMVLIEADAYDYEKIKAKYPNYYFELTEEAMGIFSKTPITIHSETTSKRNTTVLHFSTLDLNFYAVDVSAHVKYFRKPMLNFVFSQVDEKQKTIILGDFNAPFESLHFKNFKKNYQHAFTKKGFGFRETWFWNIPLLSLDHIWVSKDLEIINSTKISTTQSDHAMLKMKLNLTTSKK